MLKAKTLPEILGQVKSPGITSVILLTSEGQLLGAADSTDSDALIGMFSSFLYLLIHITAAIVSNIFATYEKNGHCHVEASELHEMILHCEVRISF